MQRTKAFKNRYTCQSLALNFIRKCAKFQSILSLTFDLMFFIKSISFFLWSPDDKCETEQANYNDVYNTVRVKKIITDADLNDLNLSSPYKKTDPFLWYTLPVYTLCMRLTGQAELFQRCSQHR